MFKKFHRDHLVGILWALILTIGVAYIFYNSVFGIPVGIGVGIYGYRAEMKRAAVRKERKILDQFKNMIIAMQSALEAGNSMENALMSAGRDLKKMYSEDSEMLVQIRLVEKKLRLNVPFEKALNEMADNIEYEEVRDFVNVITIIKRTGGNAIKVIKDTVDKLVSEIELRQELEVMVAAKKLEQQVMIYMPAFIVLFLRTTNKGFMDPLYDSMVGAGIMTVVVVANVLADMLGKKIVNIH
ncbi:MAG: type II secretion system F family protein [Eubacterium sp.]|nr:type II secretion system F family protein [Eubacterium sp.]